MSDTPELQTFRFASQCVIKHWTDPDDREKGVNINTLFGYHATRKEAKKHIKEVSKAYPDAIQFFGFFTPITMVEQTIRV